MEEFEDKKAVWVDEDDENLKINLNIKNRLKKLKKGEETLITGNEFQNRLRDQYSKINSKVDIYNWAFQEEQEKKESVDKNKLDGLLKTDRTILDSDIKKDSSLLKITQLEDVNKQASNKSIVSAVSFSRSENNTVFTAGLDKKLRIFSISSNNKSSLMQSVFFHDLPIFSAKYMNNSKEIICTGKRKHYYIYDVNSNKSNRCQGISTHFEEIKSLERVFVGENNYAFGSLDGYLLLYDIKSKSFMYDLKINGSINSVCFSKNNYFFVVGDQCEVYLFDQRKSKRCLMKFSDVGNFNTTAMTLSNNDKYLATSSNTGVVNIYDAEKILQFDDENKIDPIKTVMNLTTSVEYLSFSNNSDKLAICSRWKKHAFRILNLDNMNVYSNFPTFANQIKYPICCDFSADDKYLAIGNDEGRALLYQLF